MSKYTVNLLDNPENPPNKLQTCRFWQQKHSRCKNFPDEQKLSGAMLERSQSISVSGYSHQQIFVINSFGKFVSLASLHSQLYSPILSIY